MNSQDIIHMINKNEVIIMLKKLISINIILTLILIGLLFSWMFYCIGDPSEFGHISHTYAKMSHQDDAQVIEKVNHVKHPVGQLINKNDKTYGTAFIVDDHTIISNYHVAKGDIKHIYFKPQMNSPYPQDYPTVTLTEKFEHEKKDIAVIHTKQSLHQYEKYTLTNQRPKWFESTTSVGYPHMPDRLNTDGLNQTTYRFLFCRGGRFYVAGTIYHGASGSPMLNSEGRAYGIASFNYDIDKDHESKRISGGTYFSQNDLMWIRRHLQ